jgi:hypothetical protein
MVEATLWCGESLVEIALVFAFHWWHYGESSVKKSSKSSCSLVPEWKCLMPVFSNRIMTRNTLPRSPKTGFEQRNYAFWNGFCNPLTLTWLNTSGKSLGNMLKVTSQSTSKNSLISCAMNSGRFPQQSHEPGWLYVLLMSSSHYQ